jgi:hypothetical protein
MIVAADDGVRGLDLFRGPTAAAPAPAPVAKAAQR